MISQSINPSPTGEIVTIKLSGANLHRADYPQLVCDQLAAIDHQRCVIELTDVVGYAPRMADLQQLMPLKHVRRCAVLGNEQLDAWCQTALAPLLPEAELGFFTHSQLEDGWNWVERDN